jgi:sodium-dependent dicarboxylate transporter 2/3/5
MRARSEHIFTSVDAARSAANMTLDVVTRTRSQEGNRHIVIKPFWTKSKMIGGIAGPLLMFIFAAIPIGDDLPSAGPMLGCAIFISIYWLMQIIPLGVTALLPVILFPMWKITSTKVVATAYFNEIQFLFIGAFIVDIAIEHVSVHQRIALHILRKIGVSPPIILAGMMFIAWFFSMFCSNTSTTLMLVPFALGIIEAAEERAKNDPGQLVQVKKFGIAVLLGIAYASSLGGVATLIGTAPNGVLAGVYLTEFPEATTSVNFGNWLSFALPLSMLVTAPTWWLLKYQYIPSGTTLPLDNAFMTEELAKLGPMNRDEWVVVWVQSVQMVLWVLDGLVFQVYIGDCEGASGSSKSTCLDNDGIWTSPFAGFDGGIACACAMVLFIVPSVKNPANDLNRYTAILDWPTVVTTLPWDVIILLGAGFALAKGFAVSGLSSTIAGMFATLDVSLFVLASLVTLVIIFLTELTSNTATASILLPVLASVARALQVNPLALMVPGTVACSMAFMFPVATPPNAIVFGTGRIKFVEMARSGLVLNLIGWFCIVLATFTLGPFVFGGGNWNTPAWMTTGANSTRL